MSSTDSHAYSHRYADSNDEKRRMGADAERLVAHAVNGYVYQPADDNNGRGDYGIDVVTSNGTLIDVKSVSKSDYRLLVKEEKQHYSNAQVYVLVFENKIIGCMAANDVYDRETETFWSCNPPVDSFAVDQDDLKPLDSVMSMDYSGVDL